MTGGDRSSTAPPRPAGSDILIVDDSPSNLLSLQATLSDVATDIVCAASGTEALRLLLSRSFGLIILDFQLPDITGLEIARLVRARARCKHTPIIFLTGYSYDELIAMHTVELSAMDFLLKPAPPDVLRARVVALLKR